MRFMAFHTYDEATVSMPTPEHMAEMGQLIQEMTEARVMIATGGLKGSHTGVRMRFEKGTRTVTDGPFAESKEVIGGFVIMECATLEEAMGWCSRFARLVGDTTVEIREMWVEGDMVCTEAAVGTDAGESA